MDPVEQLGKYRLESVLGRGSMGIVYLAQDLDLGHKVAIKTLRKELLEDFNDENLLQRFKNEALAGRRLKHPNIVSIYDYGEAGDVYYLVMELVEGKRLRDFFCEDHRFTIAEICNLMRQLLDALDYAHRNGVVHRDISPNNLLIAATGELSIMDFGIAKLDTSGVTRTGVVLGTPAYMSPEQCMGQEVDQRSDIFSAGGILYHLLTGTRPFGGNSALSTMQQVLTLTPIMPSRMNVDVAADIDLVLNKALAKQPELRYARATEFADALVTALVPPRPVLTTLPVAVNTGSLIPQPVTPNLPRHDFLRDIGLAILGGFGAVIIAWYILYSVGPLFHTLDYLPTTAVSVDPAKTSYQLAYDRLKAAVPEPLHLPQDNPALAPDGSPSANKAEPR